jgi:hypothetical protein
MEMEWYRDGNKLEMITEHKWNQDYFPFITELFLICPDYLPFRTDFFPFRTIQCMRMRVPGLSPYVFAETIINLH